MDLAQELLQDPAKEIFRTIFYTDLRKGNLQNLPWYLFVTFLAWVPLAASFFTYFYTCSARFRGLSGEFVGRNLFLLLCVLSRRC